MKMYWEKNFGLGFCLEIFRKKKYTNIAEKIFLFDHEDFLVKKNFFFETKLGQMQNIYRKIIIFKELNLNKKKLEGDSNFFDQKILFNLKSIQDIKLKHSKILRVNKPRKLIHSEIDSISLPWVFKNFFFKIKGSFLETNFSFYFIDRNQTPRVHVLNLLSFFFPDLKILNFNSPEKKKKGK